jgi:hypothetical protein
MGVRIFPTIGPGLKKQKSQTFSIARCSFPALRSVSRVNQPYKVKEQTCCRGIIFLQLTPKLRWCYNSIESPVGWNYRQI